MRLGFRRCRNVRLCLFCGRRRLGIVVRSVLLFGRRQRGRVVVFVRLGIAIAKRDREIIRVAAAPLHAFLIVVILVIALSVIIALAVAAVLVMPIRFLATAADRQRGAQLVEQRQLGAARLF